MTSTCSAVNPACRPKALPVRRWQARQWHTETTNGSPVTLTRSCPQWHAASRLLMGAKASRAAGLGYRRSIASTGPTIDAQTRRRLTIRFGDAVDAWFEELAGRLAALSERWQLELGAQI